MSKWSDESFVQWFIDQYNSGMSLAEFNKQYNLNYESMKRCLKKHNVSDNGTGRFSQKYEIIDDYCVIYVRCQDGFKKVLIDIEDIEKCKSIGIWSFTKEGYVINCKNGIYLHRFVMNCPPDKEVDHIYHDLLDNRKSQLRLATSSDQKCNTHNRKDNSSGHRGVSWSEERQKWCVYLKRYDTRIAKRFDNYDEACAYADIMMENLQNEYKFKEKT